MSRRKRTRRDKRVQPPTEREQDDAMSAAWEQLKREQEQQARSKRND